MAVTQAPGSSLQHVAAPRLFRISAIVAAARVGAARSGVGCGFATSTQGHPGCRLDHACSWVGSLVHQPPSAIRTLSSEPSFSLDTGVLCRACLFRCGLRSVRVCAAAIEFSETRSPDPELDGCVGGAGDCYGRSDSRSRRGLADVEGPGHGSRLCLHCDPAERHLGVRSGDVYVVRVAPG